jgi:biopolymer transport protein ExbD
MAEPEEAVATMGQVKSLIRRRLRRRELEQEMFLNIYPMLDMMTILLVFLMAQFATEYAEIADSAELQIPMSTSEVNHQAALSVTIARNELLVEGIRIAPLQGGQIDPGILQGGSTGWKIMPLLESLREHRELQRVIDQQRGQQFAGEIQIIADKRTPYRTIAAVLYTLGQAEYRAMRFVVLQQQ